MAGHPIGEKAPIGNTDCPIGYGFYPLASHLVALGQVDFFFALTGNVSKLLQTVLANRAWFAKLASR